ncbi:DNA repair and recombination protein RadB [uncultured archaeon]|nr:DNA repair and recombination protein RadB [uncultured archaeon]
MAIKRDIVKSGIEGIDAMLGGGFTKGAITTLSGPTGCGKSTLAMQFLVNGAEQFQEPGLYIALEETRSSTYSNMAGYDWDIAKLEREKKILFLDYPIHEVDQFLFKNSAIEELIATMGIERVVIDSVMPIALLFQTDDERQKGFLKLIENIRRWGTTTLIVSEDTPATTQDVLPRTKYGMESLTDGWMHMYYLYDESGSRKRALEVLKMKGVAHMSRIVPLSISSAGVSVELPQEKPAPKKPR